MSKVLSSMLFLFVALSFTACNDSSSLIVGVWEQDEYMKDSGERLVFASDYSGIKIIRITDGNLINSSATSYNWKQEGDVITIYEVEDNSEIESYILNSKGQLILDNKNDTPFNKISNTTLKYY